MKSLLLILPFILAFGPFDSPKGIVEDGNESFEENRFDEAIEFYERAAGIAEDKASVEYNRANALLKKGDTEGALKSYEESNLHGSKSLKAKSYYNEGNAQFGEGKYSEAAEAFKNSLKYDSSDMDAKVNLEMAMKMIKEEQKNNKEKKDDKSKEDKDNKKGSDKKEEGKEAKSEGEKEKAGDEKKKSDIAEKKGEHMTEEEAMRLLDSLGDRNMDLQNLADMLKDSNPAGVEKDW